MTANPFQGLVLEALRALGGSARRAELQLRLGAPSPARLSRALTALRLAAAVRRAGVGRAQRYLLPRSIPGVGSEIPVVRIDAAGQATPFGCIVPLQGGRFWVEEADGVHELHDGLPWFLNDMRPQGFMGRSFAHAHPTLQLGADPSRWSDDDVLRAMALFGDDLPGNLVVGHAAFLRWQQLSARLPNLPNLSRLPNVQHVASFHDYPRLAAQALHGTLTGSSAGGEQPKFCTQVDGRPVIVKFSPPGATPVEQRVRDLLVCEHLALQTLAAAGLPAARSQIFLADQRVFLEVERFDRAALAGTAPGRIGMVSLRIYDAQYIGCEDNWAATAKRMAAHQPQPLLSAQDAARLCLLEAFGVLIANTDRHYGNISLLLDAAGDWELSPTYDMLPMLYAPVHGELVARDLAQWPPPPSAATLTVWPQAQALAMAFWQAAVRDGRISADFQAIAAQHVQRLAAAQG